MSSEHLARLELCSELPVIRDRLFRAGLFATAQKMDLAVKEVGFETERLLEKEIKDG